MKQAAQLPLSSFDVAQHSVGIRQPLISHNYQMVTSGSSGLDAKTNNMGMMRLDSDRGPDTQLMLLPSSNHHGHNQLQHQESGSMHLSTDPGGHSATLLHAVPFDQQQHSSTYVNRQASQQFGGSNNVAAAASSFPNNWIKSPAASSGRSVAFSNLPNNKQLLTSQGINNAGTRESNSNTPAIAEEQQPTLSNH